MHKVGKSQGFVGIKIIMSGADIVLRRDLPKMGAHLYIQGEFNFAFLKHKTDSETCLKWGLVGIFQINSELIWNIPTRPHVRQVSIKGIWACR